MARVCTVSGPFGVKDAFVLLRVAFAVGEVAFRSREWGSVREPLTYSYTIEA